MSIKEVAPGLCCLAGIAGLSFHMYNESLALQSTQSAPPAGPGSAQSSIRRAQRIVAVRPDVPPAGGDSGRIVVTYLDRDGQKQSMNVTVEDAAGYFASLQAAPDLGSFLLDFKESPFLEEAPLDDPQALKGWLRDQLSTIDRPPAADFPDWFRSPLADAADRFEMPPPPSPTAP